MFLSGLGKNLHSSLPFRQAALKFCLPWASLGFFSLFSWKLTCLVGPYPLGPYPYPVRIKSYLPGRKIYLSWTFLSPVYFFFFLFLFLFYYFIENFGGFNFFALDMYTKVYFHYFVTLHLPSPRGRSLQVLHKYPIKTKLICTFLALQTILCLFQIFGGNPDIYRQ